VSFVFSLLSFPLKFCFSISVDLFFVLSLCCGLLLAVVWLSLVVASRLAAGTWFTGWCLSLAFTHFRAVFCFFSCLSYFGSLCGFLKKCSPRCGFFLHHENGDFSILMKDIQGR
jgi:hypothetical protein